MGRNKDIWLLTGDLGFGVLDKIKDDYPKRFLNMGVAEQNMIGVAAGMAKCGLTPIVYSITPFLIYRAYEFIRIDVNFDGPVAAGNTVGSVRYAVGATTTVYILVSVD